MYCLVSYNVSNTLIFPGYIRIGSNVWAKSFNGDYYRGQVTALSEKVYIKFEDGDTIAHDRLATALQLLFAWVTVDRGRSRAEL